MLITSYQCLFKNNNCYKTVAFGDDKYETENKTTEKISSLVFALDIFIGISISILGLAGARMGMPPMYRWIISSFGFGYIIGSVALGITAPPRGPDASAKASIIDRCKETIGKNFFNFALISSIVLITFSLIGQESGLSPKLCFSLLGIGMAGAITSACPLLSRLKWKTRWADYRIAIEGPKNN